MEEDRTKNKCAKIYYLKEIFRYTTDTFFMKIFNREGEEKEKKIGVWMKSFIIFRTDRITKRRKKKKLFLFYTWRERERKKQKGKKTLMESRRIDGILSQIWRSVEMKIMNIVQISWPSLNCNTEGFYRMPESCQSCSTIAC